MNEKICICGIGYVGLTLAVIMAEKGYHVTGFDINPEVIHNLNLGKPHFHEEGLAELLQRHLNKSLHFGTKIPEEDYDAFIITVGTPLRFGQKTPDLSSLESAAKSVAERLHNGSIVILRSTVPVGATRNIVLPVLQKKKANHGLLAFCPERTVEGRALEELQNLPQIIGGLNAASTALATKLFRKIAPNIIPVTSLETAEMVKLLDNAYRDVTFAFANQIAALCSAMTIDTLEVIHAANSDYPRNRIPVPGFVGGACLEKDPLILTYSSQLKGVDPTLIRNAREFNETLPLFVAKRIHHLLTHYGIDPRRAKVFLTGLAFKGHPETDDLRGSPSLALVATFHQLGMENLFVHDFVVKEESLRRHKLIPTTLATGFAHADAVIIGNNHSSYHSINIIDLLSTANKPLILYDSWRMIESDFIDNRMIHYEALGFQSKLLEADYDG